MNVQMAATGAPPPRTEMTVMEYGYTSDQAHDISKAGLERCLDKMAASFNE